jgi:hypothetical protein
MTAEIEYKNSQKCQIQPTFSTTGGSCTTLRLKCGYHDGKPADAAIIPLVSPLLHVVPCAMKGDQRLSYYVQARNEMEILTVSKQSRFQLLPAANGIATLINHLAATNSSLVPKSVCNYNLAFKKISVHNLYSYVESYK